MTTNAPAPATQANHPSGFRAVVTGSVFAAVLMIPRLLRIRRSPGAWMTFRIVLGAAGAGLVVLPLGLWNAWLLAVGGLGMFMTAILLPPARPQANAEDKARELGALVVVNGGKYHPRNGAAAAASLFVGAETLWVMNARLEPMLILPIKEIAAVRSEEWQRRWLLHIEWGDEKAEFRYRGTFGEHLAGVAETTLRSVTGEAAAPQAKRRAAGAGT